MSDMFLNQKKNLSQNFPFSKGVENGWDDVTE